MTDERIIAWVRMMPRDEKGYALDRWSVMDVEACIRGAVREAEEGLEEANERADLHRAQRAVADGMAASYRQEAEALRERLRLLTSS